MKLGGYFFNSITEYYLESVEALHELELLIKSIEEEGPTARGWRGKRWIITYLIKPACFTFIRQIENV